MDKRIIFSTSYQTTPTSTHLPLNSTNSHQRWTSLEITVRQHLFIYRFRHKRTHKHQTQHSASTHRNNRYQVTQPIHSIAIERGFQCNNKQTKKKNFNRTQSYTQTPSTWSQLTTVSIRISSFIINERSTNQIVLNHLTTPGYHQHTILLKLNHDRSSRNSYPPFLQTEHLLGTD